MTPLWVAPDDIDDAWQLVVPWITDALSRSGGYFSAEDIREGCKEDHFQLWLVVNDANEVDAVIITYITQTPRRKVLQIMICTGQGREHWQGMVAELERWAKQNGCDGMKLHARKGWERVLKPLGYRPTHTVLEKDFEDV